MPFASFDFKLYLKEIDPTEEYDITTLTGGLINLTVRATKTAAGSGVFPDHRSIVLKHAPPFVASIGESAPFSPFRQVVEGLALKFLAESDDIRTGCLEAGVSVPTLLHEDHNRHVIAISDLGDDLCTVDQEIAETTPSDARLVGERVGRWMGVLHSLPMSPKTLQMFENKETTALIGREVVDRMKEALEIFGVDVEESKRLCDLMRGQVEMQAGKTAFCLGDFWTGSILTDRRGKLGIVDWEFAGGGRVLQDMGQIGAPTANIMYLHIDVCERGGIQQRQGCRERIHVRRDVCGSSERNGQTKLGLVR